MEVGEDGCDGAGEAEVRRERVEGMEVMVEVGDLV